MTENIEINFRHFYTAVPSTYVTIKSPSSRVLLVSLFTLPYPAFFPATSKASNYRSKQFAMSSVKHQLQVAHMYAYKNKEQQWLIGYDAVWLAMM